MSNYGFHLTSNNLKGIEQEVEADSMREAITKAEEMNPGFFAVRGRKLDNYDDSTARADAALIEFKQAG